MLEKISFQIFLWIAGDENEMANYEQSVKILFNCVCSGINASYETSLSKEMWLSFPKMSQM